jgi:hypothetical protein
MQLVEEVLNNANVQLYVNDKQQLINIIIDYYTPYIIEQNIKIIRDSPLILEDISLKNIHENISNFVLTDMLYFIETITDIINKNEEYVFIHEDLFYPTMKAINAGANISRKISNKVTSVNPFIVSKTVNKIGKGLGTGLKLGGKAILGTGYGAYKVGEGATKAIGKLGGYGLKGLKWWFGGNQKPWGGDNPTLRRTLNNMKTTTESNTITDAEEERKKYQALLAKHEAEKEEYDRKQREANEEYLKNRRALKKERSDFAKSEYEIKNKTPFENMPHTNLFDATINRIGKIGLHAGVGATRFTGNRVFDLIGAGHGIADRLNKMRDRIPFDERLNTSNSIRDSRLQNAKNKSEFNKSLISFRENTKHKLNRYTRGAYIK